MKQLKRFMCLGVAILMVLAMTACGSKAQTKVLTLEANGVTMEYKIDADGDTIKKLTQTSSIDGSAYSEDVLAAIEESMNEYASIYAEYEGVTYKTDLSGTLLVETITIDVSDADLVSSLSDAGLLPIDGDGAKLSLEKTIDSLTAQGWTLQD